MSSHREAPETAKDPVADNTDVYAFVSPKFPKKVTFIANFIPFQNPDGGPNFYEFADDVAYDIHVSNQGKAEADITYRFLFHTKIRNPKTFLYNIGPIASIGDKNWNRPQYYSVTKIENGKSKVLAENLAVPPVNVGPRSTPNYKTLSDQAEHKIGARSVFAGQRTDAFHVDLGSVFDLGGLRPLNQAHLIKLPTMNGVNSVQSYNVHSIVLQVPIKEVSKNGNLPTDPEKPSSVIGVWASASRRKSRMYDKSKGAYVGHGPWEQVSRLGNPLFNEVIVPMAEKDTWNNGAPRDDKKYAKYVNKPELAGLLPVLYPGAFTNLAKYNKPRADLNAILLTGIPKGVVPNFSTFTGPVEADMLRLNLAIPPAANASHLGVLGGDLAGYPNGRRLGDDVVTIELRAIAGLTIPLVDPSFKPDDAASAAADGTKPIVPMGTWYFPFMPMPGGGYQTVPGTSAAS
jgi:hypothetical protein